MVAPRRLGSRTCPLADALRPWPDPPIDQRLGRLGRQTIAVGETAADAARFASGQGRGGAFS